MITPNVIESYAEEFAERYFKNGFEGFTEKYGKELAEVVKMAACDGFSAGANTIIAKVKREFDKWTTHTRGGYCGQ